MTTWLVISEPEARTYQGNPGYQDIPGKTYVYDSFVSNHKNIKVGDLFAIRDKEGLSAIARVEAVKNWPGLKAMRRCPKCKKTNIKERKTLTPKYKCDCKAEFDVPVEDQATCVIYEADLGHSFVSTPGVLSTTQLLEACPRRNPQLSIQELDLAPIRAKVLSTYPEAASLFDTEYLKAEDAAEAGDEYVPTVADTRTSTLRQIKARRGQKAFRGALEARYGHCVVTGCQVRDVLEAAHIKEYQGKQDNHVTNGLLLRADLHTLFDLDLLGIDPEGLIVRVHPRALSQYSQYDGQPLQLKSESPSLAALKLRWSRFQKRLLEKDE